MSFKCLIGLHDWKCVTTTVREGQKVRLFKCRRCDRTKAEVVG